LNLSSGRGYELYRRLPVLLQNAAVTLTGAARWAHEASPPFQKLVSFLCGAERWTGAEAWEYRTRRLQLVLAAARETRWYGKLLPSAEAIERDPWAVLASMPLLGKEEVRRDPEAFINPRFGGRLLRHGTSGTTGTPLQVYWTPESVDTERALIWRHRLRAGCRIGKCRRGMLGGHLIVPLEARKKPWWRVSALARQIYFSTYHISPENAEDYAECLQDQSIEFLEGYPSVLHALALVLSEKGLARPMKGVFFGAEPLNEIQRDVIERAFCCHVWDFYGLTERVASASEFECCSGLHVSWENCVLEIACGDGAVAGPGVPGEIAGTSLSNFAFPLLRYRTGDISSLLGGPCSCGRESPRIAKVDTKREDLLVLPGGSLLSASNLTYPFKEVGNIRQSQIYQPSISVIVIRLVPDREYSDADGKRLLEGLKTLVGEGVSLSIEIVGDIPPGPGGKFAFCVSDVRRPGSFIGSA
jgi:phenylacetate-CoA ligase